MFKFLRKYNKYILTVGGTLLLITFLIPFAFTELLQGVGRGGTTWATVGRESPRKVTVSELDRLRRELRLVERLLPAVALPLPPDLVKRPEYWFLLVREAEAAGLVPAPGTIWRGETEAQQVAQFSAMTGESPAFIRHTLARLEGVQLLMQRYSDPGNVSARRMKHHARRQFHRVTVQPVIIRAEQPGQPVEFSDAELREQLEKYADVPPGEGEMGFGYRLPHRVKLEWLRIPADAVRAAVAGSDRINPVALRKHWRRHEDEFPEVSRSAEVPDAVREDLIDELTEEALERIAQDANDRLRFDRRGLDRRRGYFVIPDEWNGLDFEELAGQLENEHGVLPDYHATGNRWLTIAEAGALPGIGEAETTKYGAEPVGLETLVRAARELEGSSTIPMQEGIAGPPLRGAGGDVYLFRIIDTDPSRPPESVDEVRQQLVEDLSRLTHYRQLKDDVERIRRVAVDEGLLALALAHDTAVGAPASLSLAFSPQLPQLGDNEAIVEQIIDHALGLPGGAPLETLPESDRILVLPVDDNLSLLVARLTAQTPLTERTYRSYAQIGFVQRQLMQQELEPEEVVDRAFSYEALADRHDFELAAQADAPAEDEQLEETDDGDAVAARG